MEAHQCPSPTIATQDGASVVDFEQPSFPQRLHRMLDDAQSKGFEHVVSWLPCGSGFRVHDVVEFVAKIAPEYFSFTRYKSFQRQLNIYGFMRISSGIASGGYCHRLFIRGKRELANMVTRVKASRKRDLVKGTAARCEPASISLQLASSFQFEKVHNSLIGDLSTEVSRVDMVGSNVALRYSEVAGSSLKLNPLFEKKTDGKQQTYLSDGISTTTNHPEALLKKELHNKAPSKKAFKWDENINLMLHTIDPDVIDEIISTFCSQPSQDNPPAPEP